MHAVEQYNTFAADYEWLFSNPTLCGDRQADTLKAILDEFGDKPRILDCACGTGLTALALARRGYSVIGTDASTGMIMQARKHAAQTEKPVLFKVCPWELLPDTIKEPVDLVYCLGNAIGHCRDAEAMFRSLHGMRAVLHRGGQLVIETQNWEKLMADRVRFTHYALRQRNNIRCITLYVWNFGSGFQEPVIVEVVLLLEQEGQVRLRTHPITYQPFHAEELFSLLLQAGFEVVSSNWTSAAPDYRVVAKAVAQ